MFTEQEIAYLKSQSLARIATVAPDAQPDVAAVSFDFDGEHFYVGGFDITRTLKYKNVRRGNAKVALVIDDLESVSPWKARGIKIHGTAEIVEGQGQKAHLRVTPFRHWTWGIGEPAFKDGQPAIIKTEHQPE